MTAPLTLDDLLAVLGDASMTKQASDDEDKDDKKDDKEKKDDADKKDDKSDEGKDKKDEKDDKDKKDLPPFMKKEAQESGAALAREIMEKVASAKLPVTTKPDTKETDMNKQAQAAGDALASAILEKLANAGDVITANGITPLATPNKNQVDVAQTVAEDDAKIKPMPTGDGIKNQGTPNQILDAIVQDTLAQGAASVDQVHTQGVAAHEGQVASHAVPNQVQTDETEKAAAVMSLVNSGVDFDQAVSLVKQAETEIKYEENQQTKQAAFNALLSKGIDFELAAALVKQAGEHWDDTKKGARAYGRSLLEGAGGYVAGGLAGAALGAAVSRGNPVGAAVGGGIGGTAGALAGTAHGIGRSMRNQHAEKKAAVDALVEAGVDFDSAVELVTAKAQELYGQ